MDHSQFNRLVNYALMFDEKQQKTIQKKIDRVLRDVRLEDPYDKWDLHDLTIYAQEVYHQPLHTVLQLLWFNLFEIQQPLLPTTRGEQWCLTYLIQLIELINQYIEKEQTEVFPHWRFQCLSPQMPKQGESKSPNTQERQVKALKHLQYKIEQNIQQSRKCLRNQGDLQQGEVIQTLFDKGEQLYYSMINFERSFLFSKV